MAAEHERDARRPAVDNADVRAVRTRQKLLAAFNDAVRQTDPADMSVSSLTRAAGVNRTSFYEHFGSPEELAVHALAELMHVVSSADIVRRSEPGMTPAEASRLALHDIVYFVHARRASYARLLGPNAPAQVRAEITTAFAEQSVRALRRLSPRPADADPRITAEFVAGGLLAVIGRWLAEPSRRWSRDRLVAALSQCLPAWIVGPDGQAPVTAPARDAGTPQQHHREESP